MPDSPSPGLTFGAAAIIALVVAGSAGAFAYTAGWLSPNRLTPPKLVAAFAPPSGPALGHRRNHAKGICFTGTFESNGKGAELSRAQAFQAGQHPVLGRFNLGTPNPEAPDGTVRVRGMGLQIATPNGEVWRMAMINAPAFPVATPESFYQLLHAAGSKDPAAMKSFVASHPEFASFGAWVEGGAWTASYAEEPYNALNAFTFVDPSGAERAVRWSLVPAAPAVAITQAELEKRGPNYLEKEITDRVGQAPQRWTMNVVIANPGDVTSDPTKAWPAGRRTIEVGTLVVQKIEAEADGPCRDVNFDPTVLPPGIRVSDDPFPAARSAAYTRSYDLRTSESRYYPHTPAAAKP
jgi:catalase